MQGTDELLKFIQPPSHGQLRGCVPRCLAMPPGVYKQKPRAGGLAMNAQPNKLTQLFATDRWYANTACQYVAST